MKENLEIYYKNLEKDLKDKLDHLFVVDNFLIEVNPGKFLMPPKYREIAERILELDVKQNDIWLLSYPRTGSTLTQELVWCVGNDLDYENAKRHIHHRAPILELDAFFGSMKYTELFVKNFSNSINKVENLSSPRFIYTHLRWNLLPRKMKSVKPKIIYISRNSKDVCVSLYHMCVLWWGFCGTFEDFSELFLQGTVPWGNYWDHVSEIWMKRNESNILFLKYEDLRNDLKTTITKLCQHLNKYFSDEQIESLMEHVSFSNMRQNEAVNRQGDLKALTDEEVKDFFMRRAQIGGWRNFMSKETAKKFDEMNKKHWSSIGLQFKD